MRIDVVADGFGEAAAKPVFMSAAVLGCLVVVVVVALFFLANERGDDVGDDVLFFLLPPRSQAGRYLRDAANDLAMRASMRAKLPAVLST